MRYQWDLYDLRNKLEILKIYYQEEEDPQQKDTILEFITIYQNIINLVIRKKNEKSILLDDSIEYADFNDFIQEQILSYRSNDTNCLNLILQSYLPFKEVYQTNNPLGDIPVISSNDEIVEITVDFIKKYVPTSFHKNFDFLFNPQKYPTSPLQISYSKTKASYGGITIIDPIFKEKYIYITRKNHLLDSEILPHESFHYLITDKDDCIMENYNTRYLQEVEGSFADILFGDYFYNHSVEFRNYFNQYRLQAYENEVCDLVIYNAFIDSLTEKGRFRINKFNKALGVYEIMPFQNQEEIINHMNIPMDISMKYALGYLVAIDLFYIYQKDPEFSFYLLKNIHFLKRENDITNLLRRNHITFMDDGYENLKKYIKKIERQN